MINLSNLSVENLEKIQKVLKIVLDLIELQGINRLAGNKIPLKRFEKEDIFYEEIVSILNGINKEEKEPVFEVLNESLKYEELKDWGNSFKSVKELERLENERMGLEFLGFSKKDLKENIILRPKNLNLINILRENKEGVDEELKERAKTRAKEIRRQFEELREKQKEKEELKKEILEKIKGKREKERITIPKTFKIQVKDNYIWINNYLLSKPHAVRSNFEFFEYVRSQPANTKIERKNLSSQFGSLSLGEQIKKKSFIKILNELGFKGEILKAFFPKRGKNMVVYRGDKITKKDLEKAGIKIPLFLKELELAHIKNSPE